MSLGRTFGQSSTSFSTPVQVWAEVEGVKTGGGRIDQAKFDSMAVGDVIYAGTPVYLDKSGGTISIITGGTGNPPNGLLWHDVVKREGDTWATGAVVDKGRVYLDRIPEIPTSVKALIPATIKFEKGV